jgi:hypothetical protein
MPQYKIDQNADGLEIKVESVKGQKEELLKAFQQCQQGQCACPTDEYQKLASMELDQAEDSIQINLIAKQGVEIDPQEIDRCLDYTIQSVSERKTD